MVALPLLDLVLTSGETSGRPVRVASQLVRSALSDLDHIEQLDDSLAPDEPASFDRQTAALMRNLYERWAQDAESLLARIGRIKPQSGLISQVEPLRDALGRTRARLSVSLDDLEQGLLDALEGRAVPIEEVRRELRLRVQQPGTHAVQTARPLAGGGNS